MKRIALLSALALVLGGCVSATKYKSVVEESQSLQGKVTASESELAALRVNSAAKAKESQEKIDGLQKQVKDLTDQVAVLQKSQADLEKDQKDLKKVNELLKSDNERLDKSITERKAEYAKTLAKLKVVVDEMGALDDTGKTAK